MKLKIDTLEKTKKGRIIFALGTSINERCTFYDVSLEKDN